MKKYHKNNPMYYGEQSRDVYLFDGKRVEKWIYDHAWSGIVEMLESGNLKPGSIFSVSSVVCSHMPAGKGEEVNDCLYHIALEKLLPITPVYDGGDMPERYEVV